MIRIITTKRLEGLEQTIATMDHELSKKDAELDFIHKTLKGKGMTLNDLFDGNIHLSWNPGKAPRVNVRKMMEGEKVS